MYRSNGWADIRVLTNSHFPRTAPVSKWRVWHITARKIGFTLNLILIKVEVKYDHSFDANFDARQMCVKSVVALPIHLILDKQEGKCDLNFDSTFDARQRRNQICYGFATTFESCQRRGQTCQLLWLQFWRASKVFKDTTALHTFDLLCQRRSKTSRLCIPLISYVKGVQRRHGFVQLWSYVMSGQRRVKDGHILRLLFKRPNNLFS